MVSKLREDEFNESDLGKFKCDLCTEIFSSESYLVQKKSEIYQLKYDMFMTFESDKGKDYAYSREFAFKYM